MNAGTVPASVIRLLLDIICSSFVSCLGIAVRVPRSTLSMSTRRRACWNRGCRRLGCSQRQARRYVARAAESGRVAVPDETVVFTVRLPVRLAAAAREHARASGRTISSVAVQALEEFLGRAHGERPSR